MSVMPFKSLRGTQPGNAGTFTVVSDETTAPRLDVHAHSSPTYTPPDCAWARRPLACQWDGHIYSRIGRVQSSLIWSEASESEEHPHRLTPDRFLFGYTTGCLDAVGGRSRLWAGTQKIPLCLKLLSLPRLQVWFGASSICWFEGNTSRECHQATHNPSLLLTGGWLQLQSSSVRRIFPVNVNKITKIEVCDIWVWAKRSEVGACHHRCPAWL